MSIADKFQVIANNAGVKVHKAVLLGKYLHIDTNKDCEMKLRELLVAMNVKKIVNLPLGADGEHLDGSRHHRIVGVF